MTKLYGVEYINSLRDGRTVWLDGKKVTDVMALLGKISMNIIYIGIKKRQRHGKIRAFVSFTIYESI